MSNTDDINVWNVLLSSRRRGVEEMQGLEQILESWRRDHGDASVAVYTPGTDGHRRLTSAGPVPFSDKLAEAGSEGVDLQRLDLPGGSVLLHNAEVPTHGPCAPEHLLIASAVSTIQLKAMLDEQSLFAMSQGVELVALYEVGLAIASILDLEKLAEEILSRAMLLLDAERGALYRLEDGVYRLTRSRGAATEEVDPARIDIAQLNASGGGTDANLLPGVRHVVAVSIESEGSARGLLVVGSEEREESFQTKDRRTLSLFANQAAIALETARLHRMEVEKHRVDRELELAAEIQQQLLPHTMPEIAGFEVLGWNRPARVVGGDYFTFREMGEDQWALVIADVSGKASPAALMVSTLDSALRVLLDKNPIDPELVERLNAHVLESSLASKYITMILSNLDAATGQLTYINAGHNQGVLLRANGEAEYLESSGPPVGLLPIASYESAQVDLAPGDLICLYSDGITECANRDEEEYELERFVALLAEHRSSPLDKIVDIIARTMTEFAEGLPQGDDQTVILLRRRPQS